MGRAAEHFGHDPQAAGRRTAEQMAAGTITKAEVNKRYKEAKELGYGDEFKEGYAQGADNL